MSNPKRSNFKPQPHFFKGILNCLGIAASTAAIIEILKHQYSIWISAALSWMLTTFVLKRMYKDQVTCHGSWLSIYVITK